MGIDVTLFRFLLHFLLERSKRNVLAQQWVKCLPYSFLCAEGRALSVVTNLRINEFRGLSVPPSSIVQFWQCSKTHIVPVIY